MYVYRFKNNNNDIIYIGKTKSMNSRMSGHSHLDVECYEDVSRIEYSKLRNNDESSIYERYLINKHKPTYNKEFNNNSDFSFELPEIEWVVWDYDLSNTKTNKKNKEQSTKVNKISMMMNLNREHNMKYCLDNVYVCKDPTPLIVSIFEDKYRELIDFEYEESRYPDAKHYCEGFEELFDIYFRECKYTENLCPTIYYKTKRKKLLETDRPCIIYFDTSGRGLNERIKYLNFAFRGGDFLRIGSKEFFLKEIESTLKVSNFYSKIECLNTYNSDFGSNMDACVDDVMYKLDGLETCFNYRKKIKQ